MVSLPENGSNPPDFLAAFFEQPASPIQDPQSDLDRLNLLPYISDLGSRITKVTKAPDGRKCSFWIYFANKLVAYIPDIEDLRKVDRMELIFSRIFERSIMLQPPRLARQWRQNEASLIMEVAIPATLPVDTLDAIITELLDDDYLAYSDEGDQPSGRKAAQVFADQAAVEHLERRFVTVKAIGGIFLHRPALSLMLDRRFREKPANADLGAVLRRLSYRPTHPYPALHSASVGGEATFNTGVRMWFKAIMDKSLNGQAELPEAASQPELIA